ncbi:MAG TPA: hypothetical protein VNN19_07990 [bacterium]|nr:hypothetical protein [bacterium]
MTDALPFPRDAAVLAHLRGYPDDQRRFANLVKQTHPRGTSAVEFLLKRPPSGEFIEALARAVQDGVEIVTAVEAAALAELPPREFLQDVAARPDFPRPLYRRDHRAIWRRAEVLAYLDALHDA